MRTRIVVTVFLLAALTLAAMVLLWTSRRPAADPVSAERQTEIPSAPLVALPAGSTKSPAPGSLARGATNKVASSEEERAAEIQKSIERIQELRFQDDTLSFVALLDELANPSKEVREAALQAVVHRGDRDAVPRLREAAERLDDPRERAAFLDAIDFLALPTLSEVSGGMTLPAPKSSDPQPQPAPR